MEDHGRMFLAIALSFIVFFLWSYFFSEKPNPGETKTEVTTIQKSTDAENKKESTEKAPAHEINPPQSISQNDTAGTLIIPERLPKELTVNTPLYQVVISEAGGDFKSFILKKYRDTVDNDSPLKELISKENQEGTICLNFQNKSLQGIDTAIFKADSSLNSFDVSEGTKTISLFWTSPDGIIIEKKYAFSADTYLIGLDVTLKNESKESFSDPLVLSLKSVDSTAKGSVGFEGPCAYINNTLENVNIKKLKKKSVYEGKIEWIAFQDRYFISSIIPKNILDSRMRISISDQNIIETQYVMPYNEIPASTSSKFGFDLYLGPKSLKILKAFNLKIDKAIHFGFFDILAKPCLWLMNFIHDHIISNYGIAIIILTIIVKILFWPLGTKSYKSMNEMKKLQPLMEGIREKYKNDKRKMNEEIMGLYKTYKINPLGGCLPMVVQIPVFFALYQMLYGAIELRHAPFLGWINDLSVPDRLFRFGFTIPFMEPPAGIPVLTLIMGVTMFIQQKLSPPPGDPTQAKMMMIMPIIFTVIFINFSSGLVLYWLVQNTLSIAQQYYISKKHK